MKLYISTKNYKVLDLPRWARKMLRRGLKKAGIDIREEGEHVEMYKKVILKRMADKIEQGLDDLGIDYIRDFAEEYTIFFEIEDDPEVREQVGAFVEKFSRSEFKKRDMIKLKFTKKITSKLAMGLLRWAGLEIWLED